MKCGQRRGYEESCEVVRFELNSEFDFMSALEGIDIVIHAAALVHKNNPQNISRDAYLEMNSIATTQFGIAARNAGVKQFIYLSSIKVNGEGGNGDKPYRYDDMLAPQDYYAQSKAEAERQLFDVATDTSMKISIIRPPLIYGPGVKANFSKLMKLAHFTVPFPFSSYAGKRSLISVWNLCSFIEFLVKNPPSKSSVYLVSDDSDCTTFEILSTLAVANGNRVMAIPVPLSLVRMFLTLIGKIEFYDKIFGHLQVDIEHTKALGWTPLHSTKEGLAKLSLSTQGALKSD